MMHDDGLHDDDDRGDDDGEDYVLKAEIGSHTLFVVLEDVRVCYICSQK